MKLSFVILETGDVTLLARRRRDGTMCQGTQLVPNRQGNGASAEPPPGQRDPLQTSDL